MNANLLEALEQHKPNLMDVYKDMVRNLFNKMVEKFGEKLEGVYSSWRYARSYERICKCIVSIENPERRWEILRKEIDEEILHEMAEKYADGVIKTWKAKIEYKLGMVQDANCEWLTGYDFRITGKKFGKDVEITQRMIVNTSKYGLPFNQFPARIKYDGKSISEKKFNRIKGMKSRWQRTELGRGVSDYQIYMMSKDGIWQRKS